MRSHAGEIHGIEQHRKISGARAGAGPSNEEIFQDFPIVCGGKGLFADLTMNEVTYDLCAGTHAHHLIVRLTLWALKILSIVHRWADIQIADVLQANPAFNLSIRNRAEGSLSQRGGSRACAFVRFRGQSGHLLRSSFSAFEPRRSLRPRRAAKMKTFNLSKRVLECRPPMHHWVSMCGFVRRPGTIRARGRSAGF